MLLALAAKGKLQDDGVLREQVKRMLDDPKSTEFSQRFATQWLDLESVDRVAVNPEFFPEFKDELKPTHKISHERTNYQQWSTFSRFWTEQYAYFLQRLKSSPDGDGNLLDNTMLLYGCCTSHTHVSQNYPLILAGGNNLGIKHGPGQTNPGNAWQATASDLHDPNNLGTGDITYWVVVGNVGAVEEFTRNGGATVRTRRIGTAP